MSGPQPSVFDLQCLVMRERILRLLERAETRVEHYTIPIRSNLKLWVLHCSDSLDLFRALGLDLNNTDVGRRIVSMPSARDNTSWDDMIPLLYQSTSHRLRRTPASLTL